MKRVLGIGGAVAVSAALLLASPANAKQIDPSTGADTPAVSTGVIHVPSDFDSRASDTRATGHYSVVGTGLRVWTEGVLDNTGKRVGTSTDKVAEYVDTNTPLNAVGEPALSYDNTTEASGGGIPGTQLIVDFDGNGTPDGILVGEPGSYGNDWWASNGSRQFVKDGAPSHEGGSGSENHGTLDQWRAAFPNATVQAFGFSLGSGVKGDGIINSITFAGTTYTFTMTKDDCKNGGWAKISDPVYKNQGQCVSHFASGK